MMSKKTIKIFLASSGELKADRDQFEILIRRLNDERRKLDKPYLDLALWEVMTEAMSPTRSQDEYNKIIPTVDIFVMLFWTKVGIYTNEEFLIAKNLFLETGKPKIFVYQKAAGDKIVEQSLKDFIAGLLTPNEEYFHGHYEHIDTLLFKVSNEIERFDSFNAEKDNSALKIDLLDFLSKNQHLGISEILKKIDDNLTYEQYDRVKWVSLNSKSAIALELLAQNVVQETKSLINSIK